MQRRKTPPPPPLAPMTTRQLAELIGVQPASIRGHMNLHGGSYFGIQPQKLPNGRLLWPGDSISRLLEKKPLTNP